MEDMLLFANLVSLAVAIMVIWFRSSAFVEYSKLFGLRILLFGYDNESNNLTFPQFLYVKTKTLFKRPISKFLVSLITCPLCLGVWLSVIAAFLYGSILMIPTFYVVILFCYFLLDRIIS
jgi:hypothetical protein